MRQVVERVIGAGQAKFRILQHKENRIAAKKGPDFACKCIFAADNRFTTTFDMASRKSFCLTAWPFGLFFSLICSLVMICFEKMILKESPHKDASTV